MEKVGTARFNKSPQEASFVSERESVYYYEGAGSEYTEDSQMMSGDLRFWLTNYLINKF